MLNYGSQVACIQTGLQELSVVTQGAAFVLCHNGGYLYLASVLGTPVIAFTGVVSPGTLQFFGKKDQLIYKKKSM